MLEPQDRSELLDLAHESIASGPDHRIPQRAPDRDWAPGLRALRATFTTLKIEGELRGCCGGLEPRSPLFEDVWHTAWASAYADSRFPPLHRRELAALEIAISVLSPLEPIAAASDEELIAALRPGVDGLVIAQGARRATFLPAVWQTLPDPRAFLAQLKQKAGLCGVGISPAMQVHRYRTECFASSSNRAFAG
jgi:hypothetical protein